MIYIKDKSKCCGCAACVQKCPQQCIDLVEDFEGFLYPKVNQDLCIGCALCERACPVINQGQGRKPLKVYAAKNKDEKIRLASSSGGVFTLLAEEVLKDGGVVFGAKFNEDWEVVHAYTETVEGLTIFRGSKYVQSRVGDTFKQAENFLKQGRKVLYSGTPCQIAGLKLFLRKEYDNLLTVDFICHGVPSPKVFSMYLDETIAREGVTGKKSVSSHPLNKKDVIKSISFRDKALGWKKYSFVLTFSAMTGAEKNIVLFSEPLNKNLFMRGFLADLYLRPSCYSCPTKRLKSGSDITIGDFWGIQNVLPQFDDDKGVSSFFVNNDKYMNIEEDMNITLISVDYKQEKQFSVENSSKIPLLRNMFFDCMSKLSLNTIIPILTISSKAKSLRYYLVSRIKYLLSK